MKFLRLDVEDSIPDAKIIWLFRQKLAEHELIKEVFLRQGILELNWPP